MDGNEKSNYDVYSEAKQPIFDRDLKTYGYELLFRSGAQDNVARIDNADLATVNVVTCGFIKSQESINQSKIVFFRVQFPFFPVSWPFCFWRKRRSRYPKLPDWLSVFWVLWS